VRIIKVLVAVSAVAATATALTMAPAMADPVNNHGKAVRPKAYDVVGVGSDTTQYLVDQLSVNYNKSHKTHNPSHPYIYSWDATPPSNPLNQTSKITPKHGCKRNLRPDGSSAGIAALPTYGTTKYRKHTYQCLDFARSSRTPKSTDPTGLAFILLAKDAITYATVRGSNAPTSLTKKDLTKIYTCAVTNWDKFKGGKAGKINPVLPQTGSGTLATFLAAIGVTTPGPCVNKVTPEENEGTDPVFRVGGVASGKPDPNVIFPFSIGSYIGQADHSAACGKKPRKHQNEFGCDQTGVLHLRWINSVSPTVGKGTKTTINPKFSPVFRRDLFDVVVATKSGGIPRRLQTFFAPSFGKGKHGYFCGSKQQAVIKDYGYLPTPLCGTVQPG
jgi:ABC-type phosphate transport system substrate-binding protein